MTYWRDLLKFLNPQSSLGVLSVLMRRCFQHGSFLPGSVQRNQGRKRSLSCSMQRLELARVMEKLCSRVLFLIWPFKKRSVSLYVIFWGRREEELLTEGPTYEGNPVFPCASCTNNAIKMLKATASVYNILLPSWQLLPEVPELIWICLDIKYVDLVISENNKR